MKPQGLFRCCAAALLLFASATASAQATRADVQALTDASARDVAALIAQPGFAETVTRVLADRPDQGVPLARVMARFDPQGRTQAARTFAAQDRQLRLRKGLPASGANLLQVRAYVPKGRTLADIPAAQLWVAVLPRGDDRRWTTLTAYDHQGRSHPLDARVAPAFPVLIVDIDTRKAVEEGMALVNAGLRARGLQSADRIAVAADGSASLDLTRLDRIRLNDDQEPWALGDAEVFAVVSGVQIGAAAPEMATVTLPWLDDDNTDYTPGQPLVIWGNYRFDAANVQLFEDDGDTNYQDLLVALTDGVKAALGVFVPEYAIVADIAGAILKAMPATWFANDTDYLDSFYLLQRGQGYVDRMGAANNAKVTLSPVTLTE
jgi:alkylated DNA nucleotide flippase Atl1